MKMIQKQRDTASFLRGSCSIFYASGSSVITTHSRRKRVGGGYFWKQKFSNHASIVEEVVWAGREIYGSHMRRKNAAVEKQNKQLCSFSFVPSL